MKNIFLTTAIVALLAACQSSNNSEQKNLPAGVHSALIKEVLQTSQYSYLRVKDGDSESWLALPKMQAAVGETYYYVGGLMMHNFESKELSRTFPEVLFIDKLSSSPTIAEVGIDPNATSPHQSMNAPVTEPEAAANTMPSTQQSIISEEVLQTSKYTYIRAKLGNKDQWLAVTKMEAKVGATYYFTGGLPMKDFESKELKRTFTEILFVDNLNTEASAVGNQIVTSTQNAGIESKGSNIDLAKKEVKVEHAKGELTIANLLQNKKSFAGKTVKIKGQVSKYSPDIMKRNWIHLQDGTDFGGKFDLTVTTDQVVKEGDIITVEGKISLDKDFGFGYFYDVIIEDGKLVK